MELKLQTEGYYNLKMRKTVWSHQRNNIQNCRQIRQ